MTGHKVEFICPVCGADVTLSDTVCPQCRALLEWDTAPVRADNSAEVRGPGQDLAPMGLGDIFDRTFRLFGRSFTRAIVVVLIVFVPVSIVLIEGSREFYSSIGAITEESASTSTPGAEEVFGMLRAFGLFGAALSLALLASLASELAVTILIRSEFVGSTMRWNEALKGAMSIRLLRAIGVVIVEGVVIVGVMVVPAVFAALSGGGIGAVVLSLLAACACIAFLLIRWSLAFTVVGCENQGVWKSLQRSWVLVEEHWWRVFGILALMAILANFAVALITTPLSMVAFWDFYREYFKALGSAGAGRPDPVLMGKAMGTMGPGVGLSMSLSMMLLALTKPVYTTILYFDLRARRREFEKAQVVHLSV